ncbi:MAG: mannosyltransferase family protein, partial [Miltoncostaeaceae bacterium]
MPWWAWIGVPLVAWLASRLFVTALGVIASTTLGRAEIGLDQAVPRALNLLGSWDTTWYLDIARRGYAFDVGQVGEVFTNVAFFPLMPIVMWAALAVGLNPFWVALLVSNAMFLVALVALYHLTRERFGQAMAVRATWVLALAPPAVAASMAYTEGLALGLAVLAGYLAWKGR